MKLFGTLSELVAVAFRKGGKEVKIQPDTQTGSGPVVVTIPDVGNNAATLITSNDIGTVTSTMIATETIVNADISTSAAIAYSKLNLQPSGAGAIVNADISATAAIDAAKIGTGVVSSTEFGYLDGVTSAIQTQLNGKQATITGAATTITSSDLTASKALQSDASGKVSASSVTSTELGYVSGVTSAIQTQLNSKAAKGANSDITSLSGLTTALSIGQGGTGQTTQQAALTALAGTQASGQYLRSNGTNTLLSAIQAGDVPTLNQNTTGTAANVTGTVAIGNGGTGQTTANAALNALLPSQASAANKYLKSDGTNTSWASASGGAGEINAVLNSSGADGTTGWTGTSVVTGSNSPLNPIVTTAFSISNAAAAESSTSGGYYPFTMPAGLKNRKLKVEFSYTTPATDVYKVSVYSGTTRVALSTDSSGSTSLPASVTGGKFTAYFDTDSSSSWTVSVTRTSGSTGPIYVTNVIVGPGIQPQGAVVGEWQSYTPTVTNLGSGSGTVLGRYRQVGSNAEILIDFKKDGTAGTGAAGVSFSLPLAGALTVNTSVISGSEKWNVGSVVSTAYTTPLAATVSVAGNTAIRLSTLGGDVGGSAFTANSVWGIQALVPIAEWAGSGTLTVAQNDVEYASNSSTSTVGGWPTDDTTSFAYGPSGSQIYDSNLSTSVTKTVRFQTPIQANDQLILELNDGTGWAPAIGFTSTVISGYGISPFKFSTSAGASSSAGVAIKRSATVTDAVVTFGRYMDYYEDAISGKLTGVGWDNINGTLTWRVRKSSAGAAVGFGLADATSSGLVSTTTQTFAGKKTFDGGALIKGDTTGNAIAAGYVGQTIISSSTGAIAPSSGNWVNVEVATPGKGTYLVFGYIQWSSSSGTVTELKAAVSQYSGNTTTDHTIFLNETNWPYVAGVVPIINVPNYVFTVSDALPTIYAKVKATGTSLAGAFDCNFMLVRIA